MKPLHSLQKTLLLLVLAGAGFMVHAQNPYQITAGARQVGLAYSTVAITGFWSSYHNQGALGFNQRLSIGVNQDNRFGLAELSNKTFGFILPSGRGSLGAVYSYYGYSEFNRHTAGLAYGMKLAPKLAAGIQVDLFSTRAATDYQNTNEVTFEAGLLYKPTPILAIGVNLFNPLPSRLRSDEIPVAVRTGVAYWFSASLMGTVELDYINPGANVVRVAAEYEIVKNLFLRGGVFSEPLGYSFGLGYTGRLLQANMGFITHESLGLTPSLSVVIHIK